MGGFRTSGKYGWLEDANPASLNLKKESTSLFLGTSPLALLPYNYEVVETAMQFVNGEEHFVALYGPSGWGKTHIISIIADRLKRDDADEPIIRSASEWLKEPVVKDVTEPLILDNVRAIAYSTEERKWFKEKLALRMKADCPTVVVYATDSEEDFDGILPSKSHWVFAEMAEPTEEERQQIVRHLANKHEVLLNESVVRMMARHLHGNGLTLYGALQTMQLVKKDWSHDSASCEACGVLMPYLFGRDGWDPRDDVYEAISSSIPQSPEGLKRDISAYFMTHLLGFDERTIACFLHIQPGSVYRKTKKIESGLEDGTVQAEANDAERAILRKFEFLD